MSHRLKGGSRKFKKVGYLCLREGDSEKNKRREKESKRDTEKQQKTEKCRKGDSD